MEIKRKNIIHYYVDNLDKMIEQDQIDILFWFFVRIHQRGIEFTTMNLTTSNTKYQSNAFWTKCLKNDLIHNI